MVQPQSERPNAVGTSGVTIFVVTTLAARGRTFLFVGTKGQAQAVIAEEAVRCGMFFVNQRWLGGLLTNFNTIQRSLARLRDLESMTTDGR